MILVKFRIGIIDSNSPNQKTYIHFRAFIDSLSDSYTSEWETTKFMGRAENFINIKDLIDKFISLDCCSSIKTRINSNVSKAKLSSFYFST